MRSPPKYLFRQLLYSQHKHLPPSNAHIPCGLQANMPEEAHGICALAVPAFQITETSWQVCDYRVNLVIRNPNSVTLTQQLGHIHVTSHSYTQQIRLSFPYRRGFRPLRYWLMWAFFYGLNSLSSRSPRLSSISRAFTPLPPSVWYSA